MYFWVSQKFCSSLIHNSKNRNAVDYKNKIYFNPRLSEIANKITASYSLIEVYHETRAFSNIYSSQICRHLQSTDKFKLKKPGKFCFYAKMYCKTFNPFNVAVLFLYSLKTSENLWFSDAFKGYRKRPSDMEWINENILEGWQSCGFATHPVIDISISNNIDIYPVIPILTMSIEITSFFTICCFKRVMVNPLSVNSTKWQIADELLECLTILWNWRLKG